jgi:hypothetical protein
MGIEGQDNLHAIGATGRRSGIAALNFLRIHGDSIAPLEKTGRRAASYVMNRYYR